MKIYPNLLTESKVWCLGHRLYILITSVHLGYIYMGELNTPRTVFWPTGLEQLELIYTYTDCLMGMVSGLT